MAESIEKLKDKYYLKDEERIFYTFRVFDLNHLTSLFFRHWLLFNTYYDWVRWQLYYDFIISISDKKIGGLFQNMWYIIISQVDIYSHTFKDVSQYKKFRDKMDEIKEASDFIQDTSIKSRNDPEQG